MVELITVMVVLGIISAIAIPRLMGNDMAGPAFRAELVSALRYAQKTAVSHRRLVCAVVTANAVTLTIASQGNSVACNTSLALPDGSTSYSSKDSAVTASATTLYFQPAGTITSDGAGSTITSGAITVTGLTSIAVQGATGYVE
jgi:MSHA pilin protein MshC